MKTTVITRDRIEAAGQKTDDLVGKDQARQDFVLSQARAGRSVDLAATRSAIVDGATMVWQSGSHIDQVSLTDVTGAKTAPESSAQGIGMQTSHDETSAAIRPVTAGAGLAGSFGVSGADFQGGSCSTTTSGTGNKLTACWAIYKITAESNSTFDYYFYDRYATANGKITPWYDPFNWDVTKIDLRSRPWKTVASRIANLVAYQPTSAITSCVSGGSLGIGYAGFSASMPVTECDDVFPYPDANSKTMQVVYDQGFVFSGANHGTEFSMVVGSWQGQTAVLADYNYAKYCHGDYSNCDGVERYDSGW